MGKEISVRRMAMSEMVVGRRRWTSRRLNIPFPSAIYTTAPADSNRGVDGGARAGRAGGGTGVSQRAVMRLMRPGRPAAVEWDICRSHRRELQEESSSMGRPAARA